MKHRFTGEYHCKVDSKGRVRLPAQLVKQMEDKQAGFVINKGFEKHLMLYPKEVWGSKTAEIDRLNIYNKKQRQVIRYFYRGATELQVDAQDRLLIPTGLIEYAGIKSEVVLFAYQSQVEIWDKASYIAMIDDEPENFSDIANEVFGGKREDDDT